METVKEPMPILTQSPFEVAVVDAEKLSAADQAFLDQRERVVEAGGRQFIEVGTALMEIRDYKDGLLYKRFGTFDAYCRERWEIQKAHAYRMIAAVKAYEDVSPRGDTGTGTVLPQTEKQLRPLTQLPTPELKKKAWQDAVEIAGSRPVRSSDVARAARKVMEAEGLKPAIVVPAKPTAAFQRIRVEDLNTIRRQLDEIDGCAHKSEDAKAAETIQASVAKIRELLPQSAITTVTTESSLSPERPHRVQFRRTKGWQKPANTVVVCRPSKFGNPYPVEKYGREKAIAMYEEWIQGPEGEPLLQEARQTLLGKNLGCYCSLDERCHADVLLHLVNAPLPAEGDAPLAKSTDSDITMKSDDAKVPNSSSMPCPSSTGVPAAAGPPMRR